MQPVYHLSTSQCIEPDVLQEMVGNQLLAGIRGEVLLIRTDRDTTICMRAADNMRQRSLDWLLKARTETASFMAGRVSKRGGRFKVITRNQAVELIAVWIFEDLRHEKYRN